MYPGAPCVLSEHSNKFEGNLNSLGIFYWAEQLRDQAANALITSL